MGDAIRARLCGAQSSTERIHQEEARCRGNRQVSRGTKSPLPPASGRYQRRKERSLDSMVEIQWVRSVLALTLLVVPAVPGYAKDRDKTNPGPASTASSTKCSTGEPPKVAARRASSSSSSQDRPERKRSGSTARNPDVASGWSMRRRLKCPNSVLKRLADDPAIESIHEDRPTSGRVEPCRRLDRCSRGPDSDWRSRAPALAWP